MFLTDSRKVAEQYHRPLLAAGRRPQGASVKEQPIVYRVRLLNDTQQIFDTRTPEHMAMFREMARQEIAADADEPAFTKASLMRVYAAPGSDISGTFPAYGSVSPLLERLVARGFQASIIAEGEHGASLAVVNPQKNVELVDSDLVDECFLREAAVTATQLPTDIGLIVREGRGHVTLALIELSGVEQVLLGQGGWPRAVLNKAIIGGINIGKYDVWRVTSVKARKGYGPLLYRLAMQYATQQGSALSSDPDGLTSSSAQAVWDRFIQQPDVETIFVDSEHDDQRGIAYSLEGDDITGLAQRYSSLLERFDRWNRDRLDSLLDGALSAATAVALGS